MARSRMLGRVRSRVDMIRFLVAIAMLLAVAPLAGAAAPETIWDRVPKPPAAPALGPADRVLIGELDWAAVREEAASLLSGFVQIPSVSGDEAAAADFWAEAARSRGLAVRRLDGPAGEVNVFVTAGAAEGPPRVVLLNHMDVVPAVPERWTHPPYSGARVDGAVWGRGSLDNKGMAVMHLMALALLERHVPDYPRQVAMLSVSDEEKGGTGASFVAANHGALIAGATLLGEGGTGLRGVDPVPPQITVYPIATSEKSNLWLDLVLELPSSGHGSIPPEEYASLVMLRALNRLTSDRFEMRLVPEIEALLKNLARYEDFPKNLFMRNPSWRILRPILNRHLSANPLTNALVRDTVTITGLQTHGPGGSNTIAPKIVAKLDCRLLPGTDPQEFLRRVKKGLGEDRIRIDVVRQGAIAASSAPDEVFAALAASLTRGQEDVLVTPFLFPASSDNNTFRGAGHRVFGLLPCRLDKAQIESIHGPDERMLEEGLEHGVRVIFETLLRLR